MQIVPNEYCNECKGCRDLRVIGMDEHSVFAKCDCGAKFDLIREGTTFKEVKEPKPVVERIAYYTRMVAKHSKTYRNANRNPYRSKRLLAYKSLMHEQIRKEGYRC